MCLMVFLKICNLGLLQTFGQVYFYASTCFLVFKSIKRLGTVGNQLGASRGSRPLSSLEQEDQPVQRDARSCPDSIRVDLAVDLKVTLIKTLRLFDSATHGGFG